MIKPPSKVAPLFIASTVVFFLGSALRFVLNEKNQTQKTNKSKMPDGIKPTSDEISESNQQTIQAEAPE